MRTRPGGKGTRKPALKKPAATPTAPPRRAKNSGGIVRAVLKGGPAGGTILNPSRLVQALRSGLAVSELDDLQEALGVPLEELSGLLGISRATLHRRRQAAEPLPLAESDRIIRFARLLRRAMDVLESLDDARRWLATPQVGLGGAVPLSFADTEVGAREVEDLLGRIEYSVYS